MILQSTNIVSEVLFMGMTVLKSEKTICICCMEEHEVKTVQVNERATYKGSTVDYSATYFYCDQADEYYMNEDQMHDNYNNMKASYAMIAPTP